VRKVATITLAVLFVLGLAASAFAIHAEIPSETQAVVAKGGTQITIGGEIRTRGELQENTSDFNSDKGDSYAAYDQRVRLWVEAKLTPNTIGKIQIESVNDDLDLTNPNQKSNDLYIWGNNRSFATGGYQAGNQKGTSLNILEAWLQYSGSGLMGFNSGAKVGHMPIKLGNGLFLDHSKYGDDAILLFMNPAQGLEVDLLTAKVREDVTRHSDDADVYVGIINYQFDKSSNVGFDVTYLNDQQTPLGALGYPYTVLPAGVTATQGTYLWNFGLRGNVNIDIFTIRGDVEFQIGKIRTISDGGPDIKLSGFAGVLGADFRIDPVTLTFEAAYGSGDKTSSNDKDESFRTTLGADQHFTYVYEYRTINACGNQYGGLCNTWYAKLGGATDFTKELSGLLNVYYLHAAKDNVVFLANNTPTLGTKKNIGWEIDAKLEYKIDKNLKYWVEGGYLFAGDFWKTDPNKDPDNAYAVRNGIQLNF
jgi:hypothetical protein